MRIKYIILGSIIFWFLRAFAGDIKTEILKINDKYKTITNLTTHFEYRLYTGANAIKPREIKSGELKKQGLRSHTTFGTIETVKNDSESMIVDRGHQIIMIARLNTAQRQKKPAEQADIPDLDELLKSCSSYNVSYSSNLETLHFTFKNARMSSAEITFSANSYIIKKMVIHYGKAGTKDEVRVELVYTGFNKDVAFDKNEFSFYNYLKFNRETGKYEAQNAYKNYKVLNYNLSDL